jgi:hypothetical protein
MKKNFLSFISFFTFYSRLSSLDFDHSHFPISLFLIFGCAYMCAHLLPYPPISALSEAFLQRVMSMYTAAHYKNSPNDLQLLSDAPAHELFCLLGPRAREAPKVGKDGKPVLPDVLCVIQVRNDKKKI